MTTAPTVSVIVSTRNRGAVLGNACETMLASELPAERWELLIVDNGSTDETPEVCAQLATAHRGRVRFVREPRPGLSVARNRGIRESTGEIVVFFDDDSFPHPTALGALVDALSEDGVQAAGGPVDPMFDGPLPAWFWGRYLPYLTAWDRGERRHDVVYNDTPRGANMAFRREAFERWGGFSRHLGRSGRRLTSGEESELCLRIELGGGRVVYVPEARVGHRVSVERLTPEWMVRRFAAQGYSEAIIDWLHFGWLGLRRGLERQRLLASLAAHERGDGADVVLRCARAARNGYRGAIPRAVATVPRHRPGSAKDAPAAR